ncbi:hypothetical protein niasHT_010660 [Heterodera trifolii]|uniref:Uncharacterized protein n=1 Tax=Heterodera trifolii TaxID=157864 RepID=A0ABD2LEI8_9BILA
MNDDDQKGGKASLFCLTYVKERDEEAECDQCPIMFIPLLIVTGFFFHSSLDHSTHTSPLLATSPLSVSSGSAAPPGAERMRLTAPLTLCPIPFCGSTADCEHSENSRLSSLLSYFQVFNPRPAEQKLRK